MFGPIDRPIDWLIGWLIACSPVTVAQAQRKCGTSPFLAAWARGIFVHHNATSHAEVWMRRGKPEAGMEAGAAGGGGRGEGGGWGGGWAGVGAGGQAGVGRRLGL